MPFCYATDVIKCYSVIIKLYVVAKCIWFFALIYTFVIAICFCGGKRPLFLLSFPVPCPELLFIKSILQIAPPDEDVLFCL